MKGIKLGMIKNIALQIIIVFLFTGCVFEGTKEQINLKVPEAIIITTSETANRIIKLQKQNTKESDELAEKIFNERPVITDEKVIKKIFNELNKLQGVRSEVSGITNGNFLFTLDLLDDKEEGLEGNVYLEDLRSITVINEETIIIPMLGGTKEKALSERTPYFIKTKINKELYDLLWPLIEIN